jgi:outer membrane protein OmpA-like peptidoglycan-associated protein
MKAPQSCPDFPGSTGRTAMRGMIFIIGGLLAASLAPAPAAAQSKNELIKSLLPPRAPITRSIKVEPSKSAPDKDLPAISLTIEFEYGSERLTPAGEKLLDQLSAALQDPSLQSFRFLIAGHTDGAGTELYNQQLSERRAAAVKAYLVAKGQIEEARLTTIGFGKSKPLNPANPMSAENRRVEIINLLN